MTKLTNNAVITAIQSLNELMSTRLPARAAFKVRKLHGALQASWTIVGEVHKSLLDQFASKDAEGKMITLTGPSGEETPTFAEGQEALFQAEWVKLLNTEVEISDSLSVADLGTAEITPAMAVALGDLLTDN